MVLLQLIKYRHKRRQGLSFSIIAWVELKELLLSVILLEIALASDNITMILKEEVVFAGMYSTKEILVIKPSSFPQFT